MDTISKNKSLISIIIFLLVMNVAMLVFFLVLNNPAQKTRRDQNGISDVLQKEVGFTKQQLDAYQSLRKGHSDTIHFLFDELRKAKTDFYNLIYTAQVSDSSVKKASDMIAQKQKALDLQMFSHFKLVRNISTPDQLQKFDTTIKNVITRMTARSGKNVRDR